MVTGVPYAMAFIGYASSVMGDRMGEVVEELITPVEAVRFRTGGGVAIGPRYLNQLFELMPPGAEAEYDAGNGKVSTRGVLESWFSLCLYRNFAHIEGETDPRAAGLLALSRGTYLLADPVLRQAPFADANTPLLEQYVGPFQPDETTCANAPDQMVAKWYNPALMDKWIARFSARHLGTREDDTTVPARVYEIVDRYLPGNQLGAQDKLVQLAVLNSAYSAYLKLQSEYAQASSSDVAQRRQGGAWLEAARTGARMLLVMRQIAEAAIYLFGAFLPVFIAVAGFGLLFKYVRMVFWLQLWIPIFVLFNAVSDFYLLKAVASLQQCVGGTCSLPLNFEVVDKLRTETGQIVGYIGLLCVSVPGLAWGIMKGAEGIGGMAGNLMSTHEGSRAGAASTVDRTGAMTNYSAGTMGASAYAAGIGQSERGGTMHGVDRWGSLGAVQNTAEVNMAAAMKVDAPMKAGRLEAASGLGAGAIAQGAGLGLTRDTMGQLAMKDRYDAAKDAGIDAGESYADSVGREKQFSSATWNLGDGTQMTAHTFDGVLNYGTSEGVKGGGSFSSTFGADMKDVTSRRQGWFTFNDGSGNMRVLNGEIAFTGDGFRANAVELGTGRSLSITGAASGVNQETGLVSGYRTFAEQTNTGISDRANVSKAEALELLSSLKGTSFYRGVEAMKDGPVAITAERNGATGEIATATATQGGRSHKYDHSQRLIGNKNTMEAVTVTETGSRTTTGNVTTQYNDRTNVEMSTNYNVGNDLSGMIVRNDREGFSKTYARAFQGDVPTNEGMALIDRAADTLGGWGSIEKFVQESVSVDGGLKVGTGPLSKIVGVSVDAGGAKKAAHTLTANEIRAALVKDYDNTMRQTVLRPEEKAGRMLGNFNQLQQIIAHRAEMSIIQEMVSIPPNVARGDHKPQNEEPGGGASGSW